MRPNSHTEASQDIEGFLSPYDYANQRDANNFCPVAASEPASADSDNDDHHDPGMTFNDHTANEFVSQTQGDGSKTFGPFSGENLIAAPNMVKFFCSSFFKQDVWDNSNWDDAG